MDEALSRVMSRTGVPALYRLSTFLLTPTESQSVYVASASPSQCPEPCDRAWAGTIEHIWREEVSPEEVGNLSKWSVILGILNCKLK